MGTFPRLGRNLIANFVGKGVTAVMAVAFVPLYIRFMGVEAYGLVGLYVTILAISSIVDLGLSTTLNRELARLSAQPGQAQQAYDLVRSLEICYWAIAILVGIVVALGAPFIAAEWVQAATIPRPIVQTSITLMGMILLFQLPLTFYSGGLMGLQRQVVLNTINVVLLTTRNVGAVLILWLVSPSIIGFFSWQVAIGMLHTGVMAVVLWRSLPKAEQPAHIRPALLRDIWRFAAGMSGISLVTVLLTQVDKLILLRLLPLEDFGYYTLASAVANGLSSFILPIFSVIFPSFTHLVILKDEVGLRRLYHQSCQLMSVIVLPLAIVIALFSYEILLLWTGDLQTTEQSHLLVSVLIIGTALNGMMNPPYALQLAYGWTSLAFYQNIISVVILLPLLIWATQAYGALGAAILWVVLNAGYILISIPVMHTRLLKGEKLRWYAQDIGLPLVCAVGVGLLVRLIFPMHLLPLVMVAALGGTVMIATGLAALSTAHVRGLILRTVFKG